jgi:hypothetical protein
MEFEPVRERLARQLHARGVHVACHPRRVLDGFIEPISFTRPDGSVYTPAINGVYGNRIPRYRDFHS